MMQPPLLVDKLPGRSFDCSFNVVKGRWEEQTRPNNWGPGVTDHAIKQFKSRVVRLKTSHAKQFLEHLLLHTDMEDGEAVYWWGGQLFSLIIKQKVVLTVLPADNYKPFMKRRKIA